jgi:hypothetical protein
MTSSRPRHARSAYWTALVAFAGAALLVWATLPSNDSPRATAAPAPPARPPAALLAATSSGPADALPQRAAALEARPIEEPGATALESDDERVQPHPISDERSALAPPWATVDAVKAALEARDFELARAILAKQRAADAHSEDFRDFYQGLEIMTECLDSPGAASRARANAFIVEYRASPLRRHVRRKCLP